jgi:DNA polymerase III epsilon subunit-like protein
METRWDSKEYTLSKLTTEEYIRDTKFLAFGACIHEYGTDAITQWYGGDELHRILSTYDWTKTAVLAHNAQFDVSILSWRYNVRPAFIFDSLSMARALRGVEVGNSLAKLASDFGLPPKGRAVYSTDGLADITPEIEKELAEYCKHDVFLCEEIFKRLVKGYPAKELRLIDMTMKMYTHPMLELDEDMLFNALHEEREAREALLERLQIADADLASNDRFAELLRKVGMEPPTKKKKPTVKTPNPVGENYAFAKTDAMFQAMLNGDNEDVRQLCEARLKVKSTSERTRAQRFLDIAGRGTLPVPLSYYGAATGRWTACLVADTEVTVYDRHNGQCVKRIVDVLPDDLVWDGVEFVQHEGVQFSGYKDVMTYDGITGTPDHKVFLDDDTTISLFDACTNGARIMDAAEPDARALDAARARLKRLRW